MRHEYCLLVFLPLVSQLVKDVQEGQLESTSKTVLGLCHIFDLNRNKVEEAGRKEPSRQVPHTSFVTILFLLS